MQGQADALSEKGYTYNVFDVLTFNSYIELTDYYLPWKQGSDRSFAPEACSASVAVGSATADGKIVMAHNFWWDYLMGSRWRVILDIRPEGGHHLMMDACPGFIESGTDWAINSAGIALCETTISNFVGFDPKGIPEFQRMRKAIPTGDFGAPEDIAYGILYLISDESRFVTGTELVIDGGMNAI